MLSCLFIAAFKHIETQPISSNPRSRFGDYEILREDLGVHLDQLLGSGAQGSVYRGKLRKDKKWIDVAVKTPKFGGKSRQRRSYFHSNNWSVTMRDDMYVFFFLVVVVVVVVFFCKIMVRIICDNLWEKIRCNTLVSHIGLYLKHVKGTLNRYNIVP